MHFFCCLFERLVVFYATIACVVVLLAVAVYFTCFDIFQLSHEHV